MLKGIYTASKVCHASKWVALRERGWLISATWIDEAGEGQTACLTDLWRRCVDEASSSDAVLLYVEPGEQLKGALVEVGAALACGVPVYVVGDVQASWKKHPLVTVCDSVEHALSLMRKNREARGTP